MSTDTGGLAITRICKVSTTDGIVFVSGYNQTETLIETQYITGTCSSSPATTGVNEIDGEPDGVFPTAFSGSGYYQVVFTPVLIADDTIVSVWWKTVAGNYGNLYIKGLIDGTWYTLKSSIAQGSSLGRWESTPELLSYSGQVLSAVQFGFSTSTGGHQFVMDGLRILDFYPALVTTKAWIVQTDGSSITAGDENTLDGVTTVLGSVNVSSTSVLIAYSDLLEDVPGTGLKLMVLSIDGTTVTINAAYLLDEFGADNCSLIDFGNGSSFGVIYTIGTVQYFRTVSVSGTEITDNNDKILAISGGYTLGKNTSYVTDKVIVPLFYSPDNEGYYCIINNA